jgi:uncharacterized metal-binding protein YceD (DUF177 family)
MNESKGLPRPPLERFYDLSGLSDAGDQVTVAAKPDDLPRLAEWLGVDAVERFEGTVSLRRLSADRFDYEAEAVADVVQTCVVSLEPVKSHLERRFSRVLQMAPRRGPPRPTDEAKGGVLTLAAGDDEVPEELDSPRFDLAAPLLEELALTVEPYPRAPGVAFEAPSKAKSASDNPFAALKRLKGQGS